MNTLILGNPGTGKTTSIVKHIEKIIKQGFSPSDITLLSHTKVAAKELINRIDEKDITAGTIHSFAYYLSKIASDQVVNTSDICKFSEGIGIFMKGAGSVSEDTLGSGDEYMSVISYARACRQPLPWAYKIKGMPGSLQEFEYFYENYCAWKNTYGYIDFDDMIDLAIKSDINVSLPALLIDEAQDISVSQWKLIDKISINTEEMVVVGDPDQALFGWGGANPKGMIEWAKRVDAKVDHLSQSYRVPVRPYMLSKKILSHVKNRYEKDYLPVEKEGEVNKYLSPAHYDIKGLDNALILYRNHVLRGEIENELVFSGKAYTTLNGLPGLCQNKYGKGLKAWLNIRKSEFPDKKDISMVRKIATPAYLKAIITNDLDKIKNMEGTSALNIPAHLLKYYRSVNLDDAHKIKLSTIHGAKGTEHDRVILITKATQRVMDEFLVNPDPEFLVWYVAVTRTRNILDIIDDGSDSII